LVADSVSQPDPKRAGPFGGGARAAARPPGAANAAAAASGSAQRGGAHRGRSAAAAQATAQEAGGGALGTHAVAESEEGSFDFDGYREEGLALEGMDLDF
jgi:hypothetical protein